MVVPPPHMVHNKCQVRAAIRVELSAMANGTNGTGLRVAIVAPDGLIRDGFCIFFRDTGSRSWRRGQHLWRARALRPSAPARRLSCQVQ
jgi:hypothetical protein